MHNSPFCFFAGRRIIPSVYPEPCEGEQANAFSSHSFPNEWFTLRALPEGVACVDRNLSFTLSVLRRVDRSDVHDHFVTSNRFTLSTLSQSFTLNCEAVSPDAAQPTSKSQIRRIKRLRKQRTHPQHFGLPRQIRQHHRNIPAEFPDNLSARPAR
jgi:hypothetical protein